MSFLKGMSNKRCKAVFIKTAVFIVYFIKGVNPFGILSFHKCKKNFLFCLKVIINRCSWKRSLRTYLLYGYVSKFHCFVKCFTGIYNFFTSFYCQFIRFIFHKYTSKLIDIISAKLLYCVSDTASIFLWNTLSARLFWNIITVVFWEFGYVYMGWLYSLKEKILKIAIDTLFFVW